MIYHGLPHLICTDEFIPDLPIPLLPHDYPTVYPPMFKVLFMNQSLHRWYTSGNDCIVVIETFMHTHLMIMFLKPFMDKFHGKVIRIGKVKTYRKNHDYLVINFQNTDPKVLFTEIQNKDILPSVNICITTRVHPSCDECQYRLEHLNGDCSVLEIPPIDSEDGMAYCQVPIYRASFAIKLD